MESCGRMRPVVVVSASLVFIERVICLLSIIMLLVLVLDVENRRAG